MKFILRPLCLMIIGIPRVFAQLTTLYIPPHLTDNNYTAAQDSHYVALNTAAISNNRLLVFLPGTGAKTKHYTYFPALAADLGYHCVAVAYPNGYPSIASLCAGNADTNCYRNISQEVCYGTDVSSNVNVDTLNCINTRLVKLLQYLSTTYPANGWGQFLNGASLAWGTIVVSGHSQGSGHALYLAKTQSCDRVIMFSGADDYSNLYSKPANWVYIPGYTAINRHFSFLHLQDDVWDYSKQFSVVQAAGMTANGDDSTLVDNITSPYLNSHCLYTNVTPLHAGIYSSFHNAPVVDYYTPLGNGSQALYTPVWTYMLTVNTSTGIEQNSTKTGLKIFPNPFNNEITITELNTNTARILQVINTFGQIVLEKNIPSLVSDHSITIDLNMLSPGLYIIRVGNFTARCLKG